MSTDINVGSLPKLHKEDGSNIVEVALKIDKIHKSLLNDWSLLKVLVVSLKMLGGVKPGLAHAFPLVTTLSSGFSSCHLQNREANTTKQSTKYSNKLD